MEAKVRQGRFEEALALRDDGNLAVPPDRLFWLGQACIGLNKLEEAENMLLRFQSLKPQSFSSETAMSLAGIYSARGEVAKAIKVLEPARQMGNLESLARSATILLNAGRLEEAADMLRGVPSETLARHLSLAMAQAEILLAKKSPSEAAAAFGQLIPRSYAMPENELARAHLGLVEAEISLNPVEAYRLGLNFLKTSWNPTAVEKMSRLLGAAKLLRSEDSAGLPPLARGHFLLDLASSMEEQSSRVALNALEQMNSLPDHPRHAEATLALAALHARLGDLVKARASLALLDGKATAPHIQARRHFVEGLLAAREGKFPESAQAFEAAGKLGGDTTVQAWHNAAASAISAGDVPLLNRAKASLESLAFSNPQVRETLWGVERQEGRKLLADPTHRNEGRALLERFLAANPDHAEATAIKFALAEAGIVGDKRAKDNAAKTLQQLAKQASLNDVDREHLRYLEFWRAVAEVDPENIRSIGQEFLQSHPNSPYSPELRIRLAWDLLGQGKRAQALKECQQVLEQSSSLPLSSSAHFLAASAILGQGDPEEAISRWSELAKTAEPEMKSICQQQQAFALCQKGEWKSALAVFDRLLEEKPKGTRLYQILMAKAECLLVLADMGQSDMAKAITAFEAIAAEEKAPPQWIKASLLRLGMIQQGLGEEDRAITSYQQVLLPQDLAANSLAYRAGFGAIALLEKRAEGKETAVEIARKLANAPGPRAEEALAVEESLRTKHFLWDE